MTLTPLVFGTLPMQRSVLLHAPRYYKYLATFKSSFDLNLGIRSYARKTDQKIRIVCASSDGQITRRRPIALLYDDSHLYEPFDCRMKLRGSAAPEPKNTKKSSTERASQAKILHFVGASKNTYFCDLDPARFRHPAYAEICASACA